jgi:hypothetical protein
MEWTFMNPEPCKKSSQKIKLMVILTLIGMVLFICIAGCQSLPIKTAIPPTTTIPETNVVPPTKTNVPTETSYQQLSATHDLSRYAFPASIDPAQRYMFYLHGKIIEDQGIPAVSPDYGEYEYEAILDKLSGYGFIVISEQREKDTDGGLGYARKIVGQVKDLLNRGIPANHITVVGASKGAGITIFVSHFLENEDVNFVIMGICHPDEVSYLEQEGIYLHGNVLSIFDAVDGFAGSCQDLFNFSEGRGLSRHDEIVLHVGTGHGILYKPLDEWIAPLIQWAESP